MPANGRRFFAEDPSKHFHSIDADGSGEISFEEWEAGFGHDDVFSPHLRVLFDELDRAVLTSTQCCFETDNYAARLAGPMSVAEPATLGLLGFGMAGLGLALRRRAAPLLRVPHAPAHTRRRR